MAVGGQVDDGADEDRRGVREDDLEEAGASDGDCGVVGE